MPIGRRRKSGFGNAPSTGMTPTTSASAESLPLVIPRRTVHGGRWRRSRAQAYQPYCSYWQFASGLFAEPDRLGRGTYSFNGSRPNEHRLPGAERRFATITSAEGGLFRRSSAVRDARGRHSDKTSVIFQRRAPFVEAETPNSHRTWLFPDSPSTSGNRNGPQERPGSPSIATAPPANSHIPPNLLTLISSHFQPRSPRASADSPRATP